MLFSFLFVLLLTIHGPARAQQQVLATTNHGFPRLNFSSPSPLIFHSTFGLLQQWPNTFFDIGHTIASCRIPKNTNLYHASADSKPLPNPEWFALDPQMAYAILGVLPDSHLHTFRTQREVQALYFDGSSASLWNGASMDSQMAFIYNSTANIPPKPILELPPEFRNLTGNMTFYDWMAMERDRATRLCDFIHDRGLGGLGWGYEGIVRMNAGFEMIWCNFTSPSIKLISWLNVSAPPLENWPPFTGAGRLPNAIGPPKPQFKIAAGGFPINANPFILPAQFAWLDAAGKRYGFGDGTYGSGETRVRLDNCRISTYYDPHIQDQENTRISSERHALNLTMEGHWRGPDEVKDRAAALKMLTRRRREQRVANVSVSDGLYMRQVVEKRMQACLERKEDDSCSGIDWVNTAREIVAAHGAELHTLSKLFARYEHLAEEDIRAWFGQIRHTAHGFYMPFYEYPRFTAETVHSAFDISATGSREALTRCQTQFDPLEIEKLSDSEELTFAAISDVLSAMCGTMLPIFLSTERLWLESFNNASFSAPPPSASILAEVGEANIRNTRALEELMAWLGWADQWTACDPGCGLGEMCSIPIWPIMVIPELLRNRSAEIPMEEIEGLLKKHLWEPTCLDISEVPSL